jgi:hypothetical protein
MLLYHTLALSLLLSFRDRRFLKFLNPYPPVKTPVQMPMMTTSVGLSNPSHHRRGTEDFNAS